MVAILEKINFDKTNLTKWKKDDLIDLLDDYPNLLEKSDEELETLSTNLYFKAQDLYERTNWIEQDAENIKLLMKIRKEQINND